MDGVKQEFRTWSKTSWKEVNKTGRGLFNASDETMNKFVHKKVHFLQTCSRRGYWENCLELLVDSLTLRYTIKMHNRFNVKKVIKFASNLNLLSPVLLNWNWTWKIMIYHNLYTVWCQIKYSFLLKFEVFFHHNLFLLDLPCKYVTTPLLIIFALWITWGDSYG